MSLIEIIAGVKIFKNDNLSILFGCPPEIIKHLMLQNIPFPDFIIIPDKLYHEGVLQNSTEFPLYYFLFIMGNFQKGNKLNIAGNKFQVQCNRKLLQLSLLGPSVKEFNSIGSSKYYRELYNESRYLAIKGSDGKELTIDGFVDFHSFKDDELHLTKNNQTTTVLHKEKNIYEIDGELIDINFTGSQKISYDLKQNFVSSIPDRFGVDILGGGSGFTANKPCSALLLNYNSDYMLLDCPPYLDASLYARGISRQQIKSIYLTHIHDDHCNMFPLLQFNNKIKFLGTKEIYWMALKKLSLQIEHDLDELYSFFDFVEMTPYQENDFYGMTIIPHYTVHSIPTAGATFKMKTGNHERSIVFVGDNKSLDDIKVMRDEGIVSSEKYDYLRNLYRERFNMIFPDGGMGILHGDPRDSIESRSERIIFMHLEEMPSEFDATFSLARVGNHYSAIEGNINTTQTYQVKTMQIIQSSFPGISNEWSTAIMSDTTIRNYNSGDVIMKQGEQSRGLIYIILSGKCSVMHHNGHELRELALKESGDFIGEMAAVNRQDERSASIVARTPVTLCSISERTFYSFLQDEGRIEPMKELWLIRSELERYAPFKGFSDFVNEKIARMSKRRTVKPGEIVIKQGSEDDQFYIILNGKFIVEHGSIEVKELTSGDLFGEHASLTHNIRNSTIKALEDSVILELQHKDIESIVASTPTFNFYIYEIMRSRTKELSELS